VWGLSYWPHTESQIDSTLLAKRTELQNRGQMSPSSAGELSVIENQIASQYLANSYLGRMGRSIEPLVKPLGWDWRIGCAAIASFPAREVVVATLGVIYNLGAGQ